MSKFWIDVHNRLYTVEASIYYNYIHCSRSSEGKKKGINKFWYLSNIGDSFDDNSNITEK